MDNVTKDEIFKIQQIVDQAIVDCFEKRITLQDLPDKLRKYLSYFNVLPGEYITKIDILSDKFYWQDNDPKKLEYINSWIAKWYKEIQSAKKA